MTTLISLQKNNDVEKLVKQLAKRDRYGLGKAMKRVFENYLDSCSSFARIYALCVPAFFVLGIIGPFAPPPSLFFFAASAVLLAVWVAQALVLQKGHNQKTCSLSLDEKRETVAQHFRDLVTRHREAILGDTSDIQTLRLRLERAEEQARLSKKHWKKRASDTDSPQIAKSHLKSAERIEARVASALVSLDRQKGKLLSFFRSCEGQLTHIEADLSDHFEEQRLLELSRETETLTEEVETIGRTVATSFITDALRLQTSLQGAHDYAISTITPGIGINDIDALAEHIIAFEDSSATMLEELELSLEHAPN